ncbi:hypothetical protein [Mucilaginibacter sp.]|nr:hypothetical protein [Mucilaginibacter sp.]HTI59895.1 hypothetical protein [Mucilaginibacter sp.]
MKKKLISMVSLAAMCAILFTSCAPHHALPPPPPKPPAPSR